MLGHSGWEALRALREGKVIDLDGLLFVMDAGELAPGDDYIGARNTVDVYTCRSINTEGGWVNPVGIGYPFDTPECIKVRFADDGSTADYVVPKDLLPSKAIAR